MLAVVSSDAQTRDAYAIPVSQVVDAWPDVLGDLLVTACPYKGLGAFTPEDGEAGLFVGRDKEVIQLRLMVAQQPLVVVTGPSGVGKSSLVSAGLIRALRDEGWITESFRPGAMPLEALAKALFRVEQPDGSPTLDDLEKWLRRLRKEGLTRLGSKLALARDRPVLLCADQLEEVLDHDTCTPEERAEFLTLMLAMRPAQQPGLRLVCTLRADFLSQLLEHPEAGTILRDRWFTLSPMGKDRLEQVITEPAAARGVRYEEGLVPLIADDAGGGGGLPLLEFALAELWHLQRRRQITLTEYHRIGRVTGALSRYADGAYQDLIRRFTEDKIRRTMLALVRSRGGAAEATRQTVSRARLRHDWPIAEALGRHRLLVLGRDPAKDDDSAEIAHEALIREWPRLASWVDADADFTRWRTALEERAAEGDDLLSAARIAEADRWLAERPGEVPREVVELIQRSKSAWQRRIAELEEARRRAEEAACQAEARRLAAAAELALASHGVALHVPIALAIESLLREPTVEGDMATRHAIRRAAVQFGRFEHGESVTALAFSPDGTQLATGSSSSKLAGRGNVRVLEAVTGAEVWQALHRGPVNAVAFSPDGARVVTGSDVGSARMLDAASGAELWRLGYDGPVNAVAFSMDGARIVAGGGDGSMRLLDAATGEETWRVDLGSLVNAVAFSPDGTRISIGTGDRFGERGSVRVLDAFTGEAAWRADHHGPVNAVAFSPGGARLAASGGNGSVRMLDAATGEEAWRVTQGGPVNAVAFSPDGTRVATASGSVPGGVRRGAVRTLDAGTGAELWAVDHGGPVMTLAFSQDGVRIATGGRRMHRGCAWVLDAATGTELCRLDHDGPVNVVAFSPDGTRVATGSDDGSARVLDKAAGAELWQVSCGGSVPAIAFCSDGTRVATGSWDGSARVLDAATGTELCRLDHDGPVNVVAFSPNDAWVATGSDDGSARMLDAAARAELWRLSHEGPVNVVAFSADGARIATGSGDGTAQVLNAATGEAAWRVDPGGPVNAVAFSPDSSRVATASGMGSTKRRSSVQMLNAVSGAELWRLDHDEPFRALAFTPDGTQLAVGTDAIFGRIWALDADTGAELWHIDHEGPVHALAFSPDSTKIATGSGDGSARVLDAATGTQLCHLDHDEPVHTVVFSLDGTRVATGAGAIPEGTGSARVLDAATGTELCHLDHDGPVQAVAFSPDGTRVVTGSRDHGVRAWIVEPQQLIRQAESRLTRNFTQQEWRRYFHDEPYRKTRADLP
jgi:WD40 repeat protein